MTTYWVEISIASDWLNWAGNTQETEYALLSDNQYKLAKNVLTGDVLLHHIKGVQRWSGYSTVVKPAKKINNPQSEWEKAYPYRIEIKPEVWLDKKEELFLTKEVGGLSHQSWHRKSYVRVTKSEDAALIIEAIKKAKGANGEVDSAFIDKLNESRDATQSRTCKETADYRCVICGASGDSWREIFEKKGIHISAFGNAVAEPGWFLHAHHIRPASKGGNADLDNLLCLCPNCHQMVHKMEDDKVDSLRGRLSGK